MKAVIYIADVGSLMFQRRRSVYLSHQYYLQIEKERIISTRSSFATSPLVPKAVTASSQPDLTFELCLQASMLFDAAVRGEPSHA